MTVSRLSPTSPNLPRNSPIRSSSSLASCMRWLSCPSSQAMRYCRPLMVTLTCDMGASVLAAALAIMGINHRPDTVHGEIEPARDLAGGGFQLPRMRRRGIEIGRHARAVDAERVQLRGQCVLGVIALAPALDRGLQPVKCQSKPFGRGVNRDCV